MLRPRRRARSANLRSLFVAHPAQAPLLAVEEVDAGAGQAVPMREVEHIIGPVPAVGQVAKEGVGVGEQRGAVDPFDQGPGQLVGQAGQGLRSPLR